MQFRLALVVVAVVACTSSSEDGLSGQWEGTSADGRFYQLTLSDQDGAITGAGQIDPGSLVGDSTSISVVGAIAGDDVSLHFDTGGETIAFSGVLVDRGRLAGTITDATGTSALELVRGGEPPVDDPEDRIPELIGRWKFQSGEHRTVCGESEQTMDPRMLELEVRAGATSDLVLTGAPPNHCAEIAFSVAGSVATAAAGQPCTIEEGEVTADVTIERFTLTLDRNGTALAIDGRRKLVTSGMFELTCNDTLTGVAVKQ